MSVLDPDIWFMLLVAVLGTAGGFMAGMLGVGGGLVFIPVFQEIVRNQAAEADKVPYILANSLLVVFAVGISGSVKQHRIGNTHIPSALVTGIAAVFSSLLVSWLIRLYGIGNQRMFNYLFASLLIITGVRMWQGRHRQEENDAGFSRLPSLPKFVPAGFMAGMISALTGLGGGIVMIPYFNKVLRIPLRFSTGLSLTVIPVIALPMLIFYMYNQPVRVIYSHLQTGYMLWPAAVPMIIAASVASPFGVKAAMKMKKETLLYVYLAFVAVNIIKMLVFP